jgi:hypothetical protein
MVPYSNDVLCATRIKTIVAPLTFKCVFDSWRSHRMLSRPTGSRTRKGRTQVRVAIAFCLYEHEKTKKLRIEPQENQIGAIQQKQVLYTNEKAV